MNNTIDVELKARFNEETKSVELILGDQLLGELDEATILSWYGLDEVEAPADEAENADEDGDDGGDEDGDESGDDADGENESTDD